MNRIRVATESPKADQWRLLGQYAYPVNISRYLKNKGHTTVPTGIEEYIAGSIRQGEAYFAAAQAAPLDIKPLLLYYGASNLLIAASAMLVGDQPKIKNHGMRLDASTAARKRIADVQIRPFDPHTGALQCFCNSFSANCQIVGRGDWSLEELFGSVPDLRQDFENCYPNARYFTVPVELLSRTFVYRTEASTENKVTFEYVAPDKVERFEDPVKEITQILGFRQAYLLPQHQGEKTGITLYRKYKAAEIGLYSIYGQKYLEIPHLKSEQPITPSQVIILYMALFALGYISRYHSELWNPFVNSDTSGERLVVEKVLSIAERYIPNLVLNEVNQTQVDFVYSSGQ